MGELVECPEDDCGYEGNFRGFTSHTIASHSQKHEELRKEVMIDLYNECIGDVSKSPKFEHIKSDLPYTKQPIYKLFGSYEKFVGEVGIEYHTFTKEEILEEIQRISEEELDGERPTTFDIRDEAYFSTNIVRHYFGSMNSLFEKAGFENIHYMNVSEERLIQEIHIVDEETEGRVTARKMREEGIFSPKLFEDEFGSWNEAVERAGYDSIPKHPSGEDNPMYGKTGENNPNYENRGKESSLYIHGSPGKYNASPVYRENRRKVKKRAGGTCEAPGCMKEESDHGIDIDCHHIIPARFFNSEKERHSLDNLIILCREHHAEAEPIKRTKIESDFLV